MSVAKTEPTSIDEPKVEPKYKITPRYGVWSKDETITIQVAIPGVKKEDIKMKVLPKYFTLRAQRDEVLFALDLEMVKVEPEISKATYDEGLLKIELKRYNPLEHAFEVKIE